MAVPKVEEPTTIEETTREETDNSFSEDDDSDTDSGDNSADQEPVALPGDLNTTLPGTYIGECIEDSVAVYSFSSRQWAQGVFVYDEGVNCQGNPVAQAVIGGPFTVEEINDEGVVTWIGQVASYQRAFYVQDLVDYFNQQELHGYSDWTVGEAKECINRPTTPGGSVVATQNLFVTMIITDDGQLAVGPAAGTAEDREVDVDWSRVEYYTKQGAKSHDRTGSFANTKNRSISKTCSCRQDRTIF